MKQNIGNLVIFSIFQMKIVNPDYSGTGYLTIPLEITKHISNAYEFYKELLDDKTIETIDISFDDDFIIGKFGKPLPKNAFYRIEQSNDIEEIRFVINGVQIPIQEKAFYGIDNIINYINSQTEDFMGK